MSTYVNLFKIQKRKCKVVSNTPIPHIALSNEDKWHKRSPKDDFGAFRGGGHFWRVTPLFHVALLNKIVSSDEVGVRGTGEWPVITP